MRSLYDKRWRAQMARQAKYARLLFNDHFTVFLVIALGAFVLGYRAVLVDVTPIWWLVANLWSVVGCSFGQIATYVQPADALFVKAANASLVEDYLPRAWRWSMLVNAGIQILWTLAIVPLLWALSGSIFVIGGWLVVILAVKFSLLRRQFQTLVRHDGALNWPVAIALENKRQARWWQFYSWFAKIPQQQLPIKRRAWLDGLLNALVGQREAGLRLLFIRWVRSAELFGLYWRLLVLEIILLLGLRAAPLWLQLVIGAAVTYLLVVQLVPLREQTQGMLWTRLWPIADLKRSFSQFLSLLLVLPVLVALGLIFIF